MDPRDQEFRRRLAALGFDEVRVTAASGPLPDPLRPWLAAGRHADLHWLERTAGQRLHPGLVLPGAQSILLLGVNYWSPRLDPAPATPAAPVWARYALYEDYHDTIKPALAAAGRLLETTYGAQPTDYRYYVDTGPILERSWAARAGLGFIGKNAMLISRRHGNWLLLAAILTRVELTADAPPAPAPPPRPIGTWCGKCTRCLAACPTAAFAAPGVLDARRCIAYQTIENRGVIPRELRGGIGRRIFGCDLCLEVCPWNRFARAGRRTLLAARSELTGLSLADLLTLTPERFAQVFRRTPIKRLKLPGLLRNACVVAGNSGDPSLLPFLVPLATTHPAALVRAHAVWAIRQLGGHAQLAAARARETDPAVVAEFDAVETNSTLAPPAPGC
jgi:epoxyqueuosine reductase